MLCLGLFDDFVESKSIKLNTVHFSLSYFNFLAHFISALVLMHRLWYSNSIFFLHGSAFFLDGRKHQQLIFAIKMERTRSILWVVFANILLENFMRTILVKKKLTVLSCQIGHLLYKSFSLLQRPFINFLHYPRHPKNFKITIKNRII